MIKSISKAGRPLIAQVIAHVRDPLYRNAYALTVSTVVSGALGIVYWIVAASFYETRDIGLNSAAISTMALLAGISQLNLVIVLPRFIPEAGRATSRLIAGSYLVVSSLGLGVAGLYLLGSTWWNIDQGILGTDNAFKFWFVISIPLWSVFVLEDSVLIGLRKAIWVPVENITFSIGKIALLIFFSTSFASHGVYLAWTLPVLVLVGPVNWFIFRKFVPQHVVATQHQQTSNPFRKLGAFVVGDYISGLLALATTTLLPLMVVNLLGAKENAYFYVVWVISIALDTVAVNLSSSLIVEATNNQARLAYYVRDILLHMARFLLPISLLVFLFAPVILSVFGGTYAAEGTALLRLLALAVMPKAILVVYEGLAHVQKKVVLFTIMHAFMTIPVLTLSYIWLPQMGIAGAGVAELAVHGVLAVFVFIWGIRPLLLSVEQK